MDTIFKKKIMGDYGNEIQESYKRSYIGNGIKGTNILISDLATGLPLIQKRGRKSNKITLAGSIFTACKHFDIAPPVSLPSMNTLLGLDNSQPDTATPENLQKVILFGIAQDGAYPETTQIKPVNYSKLTAVNDMIPFRYPAVGSDLSARDRGIYFGRKQGSTNIAYYFKAFDIDPVMYAQFTDGTPIDENIYSSTNNLEAEVFVELRLIITKDDVREFFLATSTASEAKVNSIMIYEAWVKEVAGIKYYQNIQQLSKLNIVTESLADASKGLDIIYQFYY